MTRADTPKNKSVSWVFVLGVLIGLPLFLAIAMSKWLGVPSELNEPQVIFTQLRMSDVEVTEQNSLQYGKLFFFRLRVAPDELKKFVDQLQSFETREGKPQRPITLKLERAWWDPDELAEGTTWSKDLVTLWSPQKQPDLFYGAVRIDEE